MELCLLKATVPPRKLWRDCSKEGLQRCFSKISCRVSRRGFLLKSIGLGVLEVYVLPALSDPLSQSIDPERYRKLDDGVKFQDIIKGAGTEAQEGDFVEFNYVCRRSNGYFVHSTIDQFTGESKPAILPLDEKEMIKGLKEIMIGMKVGGKRRALIPPEVGYINEYLKPIPDEFGPRRSLFSHVTEPLVFEVQLLKVL